MTVTSRGTSNSGLTGSSEDRRRRKRYLLETYRADVDVLTIRKDDWEAVALLGKIAEKYGPGQVFLYDVAPGGDAGTQLWTVPLGEGEIACRCFRCGCLLTCATLECDRIVSGKKGGKYVRDNVRPCCERDNKILGNYERWDNAPSFQHHVNGQSR